MSSSPLRLLSNATRVVRTTKRLAQTSASIEKLPSDLLQIVQQHIRAHGPMPLPRYMNLCLSHPTLGYYARLRDKATDSKILGKKGDFITSPEISQVFGELLAIWFITQWQSQGMPSRTRIIELGPGKGTLMDDMLRTFSNIGIFSKTLNSINLVETSEYLRNEQKSKLAKYADRLTWANSVEDLQTSSDEFVMIVAHEFFDALPICMIEKREAGWREVLVDEAAPSNEISSKPQPKLRLVASRSPTAMSLLYSHRKDLDNLSIGTRVEICPDAYSISTKLANLLSVAGTGASLIVDYGDATHFGHSFRGFRNHQIADPLLHLGETDLTANVDFTWIKEAVGEDANTFGPEAQRDFLQKMGLEVRVEQLLKSAPTQRRMDIIKATNRLIDKTGMGKQYKVLSILPKGITAQPFPFGIEWKDSN